MENQFKAELILDEKGRITIPSEVREKLKTKTFVLLMRDNSVHIVPKITLRDLEGFAPGLTTKDLRDETDRTI
ncbi:MAG TPA: AbrB/MazE/SpoVT family DNA-binding domain-containing protein [Candidatus Nanoarchaeia archaeon]|nr:AbrB/MazE/SpoVT family DNA-binding domain-containing protein [Candidatus Nanoarchaeia archaeon]